MRSKIHTINTATVDRVSVFKPREEITYARAKKTMKNTGAKREQRSNEQWKVNNEECRRKIEIEKLRAGSRKPRLYSVESRVEDWREEIGEKQESRRKKKRK